MSRFLQDLRFAFRLLGKQPGFTAIAVATLSVAIGVNSAIFSIVNGAVLRPLVSEQPEEVVSVFTARRDSGRDYRQFSHAEYRALREESSVFSEVAALGFTLAGVGRERGEMRRSFVFLVDDTFFRLMRARPAAGRFFSAEEVRPNANLPVAVISHSLWTRLGGARDVVGGTLWVNQRPFTVIGVAPKGFSGISAVLSPEVWLPLGVYAEASGAFNAGQVRDLEDPKAYTLNVVARLVPGMDLEAARARLPVIGERLTALQPQGTEGQREVQVTVPSRFSISTSPADDGPIELIGTLLLAMSGVVLLIACLNLANMLLARGSARSREIAVRLAVGASRGQVIRQLMVEGALLALLGGSLGLLLAYWTNGALEQSFTALLGTMNFALTADLKPNLAAVASTFVVCLAATVVFSLGPALSAARTNIAGNLKAHGGEPAGTGALGRFFAPRHLLVMTQMTLSLVLLFSAALFLRGALKAAGLDVGFDPRGVTLAELDFSLTRTPEIEARRRMEGLLAQVAAFPGVQAAGFSSLVPYGNITNSARIMPAAEAAPESLAPDAPRPGKGGIYTAISPGYLEALGVKVLRGRDFSEVEGRDPASAAVCLIDEGMARELFPDADALGQRVRFTQTPRPGVPSEMEVVGIVSRHRHELDDQPSGVPGPARRLYVPHSQHYTPSVFLLVRHDASLGPRALREALARADAELPLLQLTPLADMMERSVMLWTVRLGAVMFGIFGLVALLLAAVGVYGVKAYAVQRRTREIGIRMALGADRGEVFGLIMRQGALQTALSVTLGIGLSLMVGQALAAILFQVSPADPVALGTATMVLTAATLAACIVPARRAMRVDPITSLRDE